MLTSSCLVQNTLLHYSFGVSLFFHSVYFELSLKLLLICVYFFAFFFAFSCIDLVWYFFLFVCLIPFLTFHSAFFSHVGTGLPGFNQY